MGRDSQLTWVEAACLSAVAAGLVAGCSARGGAVDPSLDLPAVAATPPDSVRAPSADADRSLSMEQRLLAGDYESVLSIYASDSTLHLLEEPTYRAALAAAMPGHSGHDPRLAAELFARLTGDHPHTRYRFEADLYARMLERDRELRGTIGRLDRELKQLKAIDLGQQPQDPEP